MVAVSNRYEVILGYLRASIQTRFRNRSQAVPHEHNTTASQLYMDLYIWPSADYLHCRGIVQAFHRGPAFFRDTIFIANIAVDARPTYARG